MTQHDKIIEMCMDRDWHCQAEFWKNYIFSPHKRRGEIEKKKDKNGNKLYEFFERPCEHGIAQSKDFLLRFLKPTETRIGTVDAAKTLPNASNFRCFKCSKDALTYLEDKPVCLDHSKKKVEVPSLF